MPIINVASYSFVEFVAEVIKAVVWHEHSKLMDEDKKKFGQ